MAGVERLMVVSNPLAANPEDQQGPGMVQRTSDFLASFSVTPQCALVGTAVGFVMQPGFAGAVKGLLLGSLVSFAVNRLGR
jgi:hypothetical protein